MDLKVLDYLTEGIIFITPDKKIGYINKTASKTIKKQIGDDCFGLFSTCKTNCPLEKYKDKEFETINQFDVSLSCCEKTVCHTITPIFENGKFIGLIEEFKDSSKITKYINELKEQKEFTEAILDSVIDAIIVIDGEGNIIHYNEVAKRILCKEIDTIEGFNIEILLGISINQLPEEGEREDIDIETPAYGKIKVSMLTTSLKNKKGKLISFYILPECMINKEAKSRIITKNTKFMSVLEMAKTVADTTANVLIEGETGTGKNVLAKYIHMLSSRRDKPFIKLNCAAIPETLLESELFGYMKGAFTGAFKDKPGKVELADGGTLFLDEIGDMPLYLQSKLLHLIQEKEFERIGDIKTRKANIRIISATNKNLKELVKKGLFREDLYYRLKVIHLVVPPLRERKEDIPLLVNYFLKKFSEEYNKKVKGVSPKAMKLLLDYDYPGNIRELENIIERAIIICDKKYIEIDHLPEEVKNFAKNEVLKENSYLNYNEEAERIREVLKQTKGNKSLAAKLLGIHRTTLWRKIKE
ncbi:MAG: sigma-54-dependent Fis family transcriptional regulator, partial [Persephonella sp.]